ncbi:MAG: MBL fold metallo-hydrolase [bacterium]
MEGFEKVAEGVYRITPEQEQGSAWESPNIYLVGADPCLLIDSGYDRADHVKLVVESVGRARVSMIVLTHAHIDHAGGARRLRQATGAPVYVHPADEPSLERRFPECRPAGYVSEPDRLEAGGTVLQVLDTPGHAPGHIVLLQETSEVLFTGDLITGAGSTLVAPPEGNMEKYMASLHRVKTLGVKKILPGHGPVVDRPEERINELIEHRELREVCILKCLAQEKLGLNGLVKSMYQGLIHPGLEMAAAGTAWAHLEKLISEGSVRAEPAEETNPFNMSFELAPGYTLPF